MPRQNGSRLPVAPDRRGAGSHGGEPPLERRDREDRRAAKDPVGRQACVDLLLRVESSRQEEKLSGDMLHRRRATIRRTAERVKRYAGLDLGPAATRAARGCP
jgi:hypothetical protein